MLNTPDCTMGLLKQTKSMDQHLLIKFQHLSHLILKSQNQNNAVINSDQTGRIKQTKCIYKYLCLLFLFVCYQFNFYVLHPVAHLICYIIAVCVGACFIDVCCCCCWLLNKQSSITPHQERKKTRKKNQEKIHPH